MSNFAPVSMQLQIETLQQRIILATGKDRENLESEHRELCALYNKIVGFKAYDVNFNEWHTIKKNIGRLKPDN